METPSKSEQARTFAAQRHGAQTYGDGTPYATHLEQVVAVLERFGYGGDEDLVCAAWLHDVVEDTPTTADEIQERFGQRIRALVWAVSNEPGRNRKERAAKTYPKILSTPDAIVVKLADRIANVEASIRSRPDLLQMYRKEWAKFSVALRNDAGPAPMWEHLETLIQGS